jgi:hypothetical protein
VERRTEFNDLHLGPCTKACNKSRIVVESDRILFIARCEVCVYSELKIIGCRMNISFWIREWWEAGRHEVRLRWVSYILYRGLKSDGQDYKGLKSTPSIPA